MRKTKRVMLLAFVIMISVMSCNSEELFVEPVGEEIVNFEDEEEIVEEEEQGSEEEEGESQEDSGTDPSLPCDFDLTTIEPNSTIIINCVLDLAGAIISVPANVIIIYEGGDIINGTLNFSDNSVISGELLSSSLTLSGSTPQLKDTTFIFDAQRWDIIEGIVTDEVALNNKTVLQSIIDQTKLMGADTFSIDKMDAYFKVGIYGTPKDLVNDAIHVPSNFHLKMSDNTTLRVQPNDWPFSILIGSYEQDNFKISGGNLIGDRWDHDYKVIINGNVNRSTHEWPVLLQVAGCENAIIEDVFMSDSTGDAFVMGNPNGKRYDGVKFNNNITIRNCTMTRSRRNNISITDADDSLIENCTITDAGLGEKVEDANGDTVYSSSGVLPRSGIDVEPFIGGEDPNNLVYYARVQRLTIRGCTLTGNANASIIDYTGEDVVIENNFSDNIINGNHGWGTKFINNTLVASEAFKHKSGISTGHSDNYTVTGNSVTGFTKGITARGETGLVANNIIRNCSSGIFVRDANNFVFENNDIEGANNIGISGYNGIGNMIFKNNKIVVDRSPMNWQVINNTGESSNNTVVFDNNQFIARETGYYVYINKSPNVTMKNNVLTKARFLVVESPNFTDSNNILN